MSSPPKPDIGRVKLPAKFAQMGLMIDPTRMRPDAWMNRKKTKTKARKRSASATLNSTPPKLSESKHAPIDFATAQLCKPILKPSIARGTRRRRSANRKLKLKPAILSIHTINPSEDETSNDTEETMDDDSAYLELQQQIIAKGHTISAQLRIIEELKHDKLILEEWKSDIGLNAIDKCANMELQLQTSHNTCAQYALETEGLQTKNHALSQQIHAYTDEIHKYETEKPKLLSQISEFEQLLSEQHMINERLQSKSNELNSLKQEMEQIKMEFAQSKTELKRVNKENETHKREKSEYLLRLDTLKSEETKLKDLLSEKCAENMELTATNEEIYDKLKRETVETRAQLQVATTFANDLSDQLEEITNFANSPRPNSCGPFDDNINGINDGIIAYDGEIDMSNIGYGQPLFEKRKTLKIESGNNSLKLPNMSDMIDMIERGNTCDVQSEVSDIGSDYESGNNTPKIFGISVKINSKILPPITQVNESMELESESQEMDRERQNSGASTDTLTFEESQSVQSLCVNEDEGFGCDEEEQKEYVHCAYVTHKEQDLIERLLRRVAGNSYNKHRNGHNGGSIRKVIGIDSETRYKLKAEFILYINQLRAEYVASVSEGKELCVTYKRMSVEWERKYKGLKREIKKRKLKTQQSKQKTNEPQIGGCKFWSWGLNPKWFDLTGTQSEQNPKESNTKTVRFVVADDSDETENNTVI